MEHLDRLGWAAGAVFTCHGARLGIRTNQAAALEGIQDHLPPGARPSSSRVVDSLYSLFVPLKDANPRIRHLHLLYADTTRLGRSTELRPLLEAFESDSHFRVALSARRRLFVHAGVVSWRGRAVVVPGHSMSGKTTLVAALVRAGATYYSDEFAPFDARGRVHPYPKPLGVRSTDGRPAGKVRIETLGRTAGSVPLAVALVVLTEYLAGARWRPRVLSTAEAVLALLGHTVVARSRPRLALDTLHRVAASAMVWRGYRGEANEVAEALLERLESFPAPGPAITGHVVGVA